MNAVTTIEEQLRTVEAWLAEHDAEYSAVVQRSHAVIAEVDAQLAPLDDELRRGLDPDSRRGKEVRQERRALHARRSEAEHRLGQRGSEFARQQRERRHELQAQLRQARFEGESDSSLEQLEKRARFRLQVARDGLNVARDMLAHYQVKLGEAREAVASDPDAGNDVAELLAERDRLQADAFIGERVPDADRLAELDAEIAEAQQAAARVEQAGAAARAAIPRLDLLIGEHHETVAEQERQVQAAEAALLAAVRNRAIRQIDAAVNALREPLLLLEAADSLAGQQLCGALSSRGLHTIGVDGSIVRPDWLHYPVYRPDGFAQEVAALRSRILTTGAAGDGSL